MFTRHELNFIWLFPVIPPLIASTGGLGLNNEPLLTTATELPLTALHVKF